MIVSFLGLTFGNSELLCLRSEFHAATQRASQAQTHSELLQDQLAEAKRQLEETHRALNTTHEAYANFLANRQVFQTPPADPSLPAQLAPKKKIYPHAAAQALTRKAYEDDLARQAAKPIAPEDAAQAIAELEKLLKLTSKKDQNAA